MLLFFVRRLQVNTFPLVRWPLFGTEEKLSPRQSHAREKSLVCVICGEDSGESDECDLCASRIW